MEYTVMDYIGGTIILGLFVGPVAVALLIQAMTFVGAVVGHAVETEPREKYIRVKQNYYDMDEDR